MAVRLFLFALGVLCSLPPARAEQATNLVSFAQAEYAINESSTNLLLRVIRSGDTNPVLSVNYEIELLTTTADEDLTLQSGTLQFASGQTNQTIVIQILNDSAIEPAETFRVLLSNPGNGFVLGHSPDALITIEDNDHAGGLDEFFNFIPSRFLPPNGTLAVNRVLPVEDGSIFFAGESTNVSSYGVITESGAPKFTLWNGSFFDGTVDPDGSLLIGGAPAPFPLIRQSSSGFLDFIFDSGLNGVAKVVALTPDRSILLGGSLRLSGETNAFGVLRILRTGKVDHEFPKEIFADSSVSALLVQDDGFLAAIIETNESSALEFRLSRYFMDGTLDQGYQEIPFDGEISILKPLPDGGLLVGGSFTQVAEEPRPYLVRLQPDGTLDTSFPSAILNGPLHAIAFQPDGKLLLGGEFTEVRGNPRSRVARLNPDASLDSSFNVGSGPNGQVRTIAVLPDGGILAGGHFNSFSGRTNFGLVRLKGDTAEEAAFLYWNRNTFSVHEQAGSASLPISRAGRTNESLTLSISANDGTATAYLDYGPVPAEITFAPGETTRMLSFPVIQDSLQEGTESFDLTLSTEDQTVLVSLASATIRTKDADSPGTRDLNFNSDAMPHITALAVQDDGKILVGHQTLKRLHPDGTLDETFRADIFTNRTSGLIYGISPQLDGKYYVWGDFDLSLTSPRLDVLLRLHNDGTLDDTFTSPYFMPSQAFIADVAVHQDGTIFVCEQGSPGGQVTVLNNSGGPIISVSPTLSHASRTPQDLTIRGDGTIFLARSRYSSAAEPIISFNAQGAVTPGFSVKLIGDGFAVEQYQDKIFLAGEFQHSETGEAMNLALLTLDGSIDTNFVARPNARVLRVLPLANGQVLISGNFTAVNGIERNRIARLNSDGTVDETFDPGLGFDSSRLNIAEMPDRKIIVAGANFGQYDGEPVPGLIRLLDSARPGELQLAGNFLAVSEDAGAITLAVARVGGSSGPLNARFRTVSQGAIADLDFEPVDLILEFADAEIGHRQVPITLTPNPGFTGEKSFAVQLLDPLTDELIDHITILIRDAQSGSAVQGYAPAPGLPISSISSVSLLDDGALFLAGTFTQVQNQPIRSLARFLPDGNLDHSFSLTDLPQGNSITHAALQDDGKLIITGNFTRWGANQAVRGVARLNPDLSLDLPFSTNRNAFSFVPEVNRLELAPNGDLLAAVTFTYLRVDSQGNDLHQLSLSTMYDFEPLPGGPVLIGTRNRVEKVNPDGSRDAAFSVAIDNSTQPGHAAVHAVRALRDGKILMGGLFVNVNGISRFRLARLHPGGTLDTAFDPGVIGVATASGNTNAVHAIELLPNGDILIAGNFETVQNVPRRHLARLAPDGKLREDWDAQIQGTHISQIKLLDNGELAIYGAITNVGGVEVQGLARIHLASNAAPVAEIISPAPGSTLAADAPVNIQLNAYDPDGLLASLKLFVNGEFHAEFHEPPYQAELTAPLGTHTLRAEAADASGFTTLSSEVTFTVAEQVEPPTLTLSSGAPGELQITVSAASGATCVLESSSDLKTWFEADQIPVSEGPVQFTIDSSAQAHLFYRIRIQP